MAQGAAERVAGAEPVDDLDRHRRHLGPLVAAARQHARRALLDDREIQALGRRRRARVAAADRRVPLVEVADRDRRVRERLRGLAGDLARLPEHRAVVEVEHRDPPAAASLQRRERRRAAGLLREPGPGDPEHARRPDRLEVELFGANLEIRRLRLAVEVQREVVGREDLAERQRRVQALDRRDVAVVDAEPAQRVVQELAERVRPRARDHRAAAGRSAPPRPRRSSRCRPGTCRTTPPRAATRRSGAGRCPR